MIMKSLLLTTALGSAIVCGSLLSAGFASAQDGTDSAQPCVGESCPKPDMKKAPDQDDMNQGDMNQGGTKKQRKNVDQSNQMNDQTEGTSDGTMKRKKKTQNSQNTDVDVDVDVRTGSSQRTRNANWQFDSGKHQRRRSKNSIFRFYYGGYYYPQPYWEVYSVSGRVSCGEGRAIVAERFNRVRVVECRGPTYTYLGRRQGDTYRIILNARTGRIIGRALI
jgi:hypothetical protein